MAIIGIFEQNFSHIERALEVKRTSQSFQTAALRAARWHRVFTKGAAR